MGIFSVFRTARWNNDPNSKELAWLLLEAATYRSTGGQQGRSLDVRKMVALIMAAGWDNRELRNRIVHAISMIKPMADRETYEAAKNIGRDLYVSL